jgi:putative peptidoglycan lipid II flippase
VASGEADMWRAANAVISGLVVAAGAVTLLMVASITVALRVGHFENETRLMLELLRMMFPYMLLACLAAVLIGMANARGHFFVPALGAALLNIVMIASVLWLAPRLGKPLEVRIFGLAIGVLLAGLVQAMFQLPSLHKEGYRYQWVYPWNDPTVREVARKMLPGSVGVAAFQINVLVTQVFSFWWDPTIVATFNYSVRLMELPQGVFGISLATYLLPTLSGLAAEKKFLEFKDTLRQGMGLLAFTNLFAAAISIALAVPIVRLLFERGMFGPDATQRVAISLACLAPGLLMFSLNNILARAFYALKDIGTPMRISVLCLLLNLGFAFWLVPQYREAGLGVANTMTATINTSLLIYALRRKLKEFALGAFSRNLLVLVGGAAAAGVIAGLAAWFWESRFGHASLAQKIAVVFVPSLAAGAVYAGIAVLGRVPAAGEITNLIRRRIR